MFAHEPQYYFPSPLTYFPTNHVCIQTKTEQIHTLSHIWYARPYMHACVTPTPELHVSRLPPIPSYIFSPSVLSCTRCLLVVAYPPMILVSITSQLLL